MAEKLSVNPWIGMWLHPRETIRAILEFNTSYLLPLLYWIYGFPILLQAAQNRALGDVYSFGYILGGTAVGAIITGFVGVNVGAALFYWTGRWLGGLGTFKQVRAAVAWSSVPTLVNIAVWATEIMVFRGYLFTRAYLELPFAGGQLAFIFFMTLIQVVVAVWGLVILLKALGEAQQFSAWKALLNIFMPFIVIFMGVQLIAWLLALLMGRIH